MRYRYKNNKYLIVSFFKNEYLPIFIIKKIKEISINKILNNDIVEPKTIDSGIIENNTKK